jgi:hypothetical protein
VEERRQGVGAWASMAAGFLCAGHGEKGMALGRYPARGGRRAWAPSMGAAGGEGRHGCKPCSLLAAVGAREEEGREDACLGWKEEREKCCGG